jgi:hypothetical protein
MPACLPACLPACVSVPTQAAVKRVLSDSEEVVAGDVGPLLKAVVATNKFEREMAALFGGKGLKEEEEDDGLQVCWPPQHSASRLAWTPRLDVRLSGSASKRTYRSVFTLNRPGLPPFCVAGG